MRRLFFSLQNGGVIRALSLRFMKNGRKVAKVDTKSPISTFAAGLSQNKNTRMLTTIHRVLPRAGVSLLPTTKIAFY
ncbi:hypothetical protein RBA41_32200 [Massilia sp. CCM 9210]|uniref:hypothetical protein n=1 Tax=Massilia scottii TaxID=3057166 RepID=UPI00279655AD|nr:hypothetical protein [Massilia sp. CCM 9210]MDQ1817973.1 hypothetical protein [Massilia sp. CCM 9210]